MAADDRGLADDDAGAVVDEEVLPYLGARADIDARATVGVLAHEARDQGNAQFEELMRDAVGKDRVDARIADEDLLEAAGCGVTVESRVDVLEHHRLDVAEAVEEGLRELICLGVDNRRAAAAVFEEQGLVDLVAEHAVDVHEALRDERVGAHAGRALVVEVAGKQQGADVVDEGDAGTPAGEVLLVLGEEGLLAAISVLDCLDVLVELLFDHRCSISRPGIRCTDEL